jgi:NADH-quinone oxidoreductase subunit L
METLKAIFPASNFSLLCAIVCLPLIGAFVNGVFGKRLGKEAVRVMALFSVGASFVGSVITFLMLRAAQAGEESAARFVWHGWKWLGLSYPMEAGQLLATGAADTLNLEVAFSVDALNGTMALIVTGVGFLIHLYSTKYMEEDPGYYRFFAYLNLFIFSMLVLILGDSLPVLFVGWEGVGLCSYLLIGFWFQGSANATAGKKAFIVNRIGDFGLLVAMALLVKYTGALDWDGIERARTGLLQEVPVWHIRGTLASVLPQWEWLLGPHHVTAATLVALALFLGCAGKSAQIPLYVWLPDAMAGPTPVSALIHAATMVTAGVYLVCRTSAIFVLSPMAMFVVAIVGALTAVFAATIAFAQNDIKKVLAYSTVSQLGYMFLGVGVGAFAAGFFHVITHAFFKACLFLGAGSVIHAMHARIHDTDASQDLRNMGGLFPFLKITGWTFLISCACIVGFPLTSGFFSKDEILFKAYTSSVGANWPSWGGPLLYTLGVMGAVMTAFYMSRLFILTFLGDFKGWKIIPGWTDPHAHASHDAHDDHGAHAAHGDDAHAHDDHSEGPEPHESPWQMWLPLAILAGLALIGGLFNAHALFHWHPLDNFLEPVFKTASELVHEKENAEHLEMPLLIPGLLAFALGVGSAYWVYVKQHGSPAKQLVERFPALHKLVYDKWRIDELYDEIFVGTLDTLAEVSVWIDRWVVDGIIARLSAWVVAVFGHVLRLFQTGNLHAYAAATVFALAGTGWFIATPHARAAVLGEKSSEGKVVLQAAPGLGYQYRWDANGDGAFDSDKFSDERELEVAVIRNGPTQTIGLEVKNAFGSTAQSSIEIEPPSDVPGAVPPEDSDQAAAPAAQPAQAPSQRPAAEEEQH